jgi:hypothetical protein
MTLLQRGIWQSLWAILILIYAFQMIDRSYAVILGFIAGIVGLAGISNVGLAMKIRRGKTNASQ